MCKHCMQCILKRSGSKKLCSECYCRQVSNKTVDFCTIKDVKSKDEMVSELPKNGVKVNESNISNVELLDLYDAYTTQNKLGFYETT